MTDRPENPGTAPRGPEPRPLFGTLQSRVAGAVFLAMLFASFIVPATGFGIPICGFKDLLGMPCPGCGLTRSVVHISHLELGEALRFHPFGLVVYALAVLSIASNAVPPLRRVLVRWLGAHEVAVRRLWWAILGAFVLFGVARIVVGVAWPELVDHL